VLTLIGIRAQPHPERAAGALALPEAGSGPSRRPYSVPEDFAGVLGFGVLFAAASPEAPEFPDEGALDDELPSPVLDFESDDDAEFPPDSLLSAFLRDSDG
jgi:hypothetical protein